MWPRRWAPGGRAQRLSHFNILGSISSWLSTQGSKARLPRFETWLDHLLVVWPWAGKSVKQSLKFLNFKMGIKTKLLWILNEMIRTHNWVQSQNVMNTRWLLCLIPVTAQMQTPSRAWRWLSDRLRVRRWIPQVPPLVLNQQGRKPQKSFRDKEINSRNDVYSVPSMVSLSLDLWIHIGRITCCTAKER